MLEHIKSREELYVAIPLTILYSTILMTGIVGNVITCVVISRNKHMRTATNYYLFSLAISDLILLISGLPQEIYMLWRRYPYVFGESFCFLRGLLAETTANATVLTITAFTVERYLAICHPFLSQTISKLSRAIKLIIIIWIVSFTFALPQSLQFGLVQDSDPDSVQCTFKTVIIPHSFELSTLFFFILPMILITVLYIRIGIKLYRSPQLNQQDGKKQYIRASGGQKANHGTSTKRLVKMLVAVVVAFFISWAPFHTQRLIGIYTRYTVEDPPSPLVVNIYIVVTQTSAILYYLSTTINPIIYHIMSHKFRNAFRETLSKACCVRGEPRSYYILHKGSTNIQDTSRKERTLRADSLASTNNSIKMVHNVQNSDKSKVVAINNGDIDGQNNVDTIIYRKVDNSFFIEPSCIHKFFIFLKIIPSKSINNADPEFLEKVVGSSDSQLEIIVGNNNSK